MNIIRTQRYTKDLKRMGVSDVEQAVLEQTIATNPDLIPGLEGLRKIRSQCEAEESAAEVVQFTISCCRTTWR